MLYRHDLLKYPALPAFWLEKGGEMHPVYPGQRLWSKKLHSWAIHFGGADINPDDWAWDQPAETPEAWAQRVAASEEFEKLVVVHDASIGPTPYTPDTRSDTENTRLLEENIRELNRSFSALNRAHEATKRDFVASAQHLTARLDALTAAYEKSVQEFGARVSTSEETVELLVKVSRALMDKAFPDGAKASATPAESSPAAPTPEPSPSPTQGFVTINGIQVQAPCREPLNDREEYWIPVTNFDFFRFGPIPWTGGKSDLLYLQRGLIHRNKEAAAAMARAMINFQGNKP